MHTDQGELFIDFPNQKYKAYLKRLGLSSDEKLDNDLIEKLFHLVFEDFKTGKIFLEELSSIGGVLWGNLNHHDQFHSKLGDALYAAMELSFYVRHIDDATCASMFVSFLKEVYDFFEKRTNTR